MERQEHRLVYLGSGKKTMETWLKAQKADRFKRHLECSKVQARKRRTQSDSYASALANLLSQGTGKKEVGVSSKFYLELLALLVNIPNNKYKD